MVKDSGLMVENTEKSGKESAVHYYDSQGFSSLSKRIAPIDASRLFFPPLSTVDKWVKGFEKEQSRILSEQE
jgi:hypothetical protein